MASDREFQSSRHPSDGAPVLADELQARAVFGMFSRFRLYLLAGIFVVEHLPLEAACHEHREADFEGDDVGFQFFQKSDMTGRDVTPFAPDSVQGVPQLGLRHVVNLNSVIKHQPVSHS